MLLALNLRAAVGSVGVVLDALRGDLGMSTTVAGVLTTLPVICFAVAGVGAHHVVRVLGLHRTTVTLLAVIAVGLVGRSLVHDSVGYLLASTVALAGAAVGNIILPPLAKVHFPDRISLISAMYGAALLGGAALSSLTTVPLSDALGGWRQGTAAWALLAPLAILPWWPFLRQEVHVDPAASRLGIRDLIGSPVAWSLMLVFGAQSAQAYAQFGWFPAMLVDAGMQDADAGAMLGLLSGVGIPVTLALPWLLRKVGDRAVLPWFFALVTVAGWAGVLRSPTEPAWLWAVLLGLGGGAFTWTMTMIGKRSRTPEGTVALSAFAQGLGYMVAGVGPFGAGYVHDLTGSWDAAIELLMALALLIGVFGALVSRPRMLEDTLR